MLLTGERIKVTGSKLPDFTTVKRPDIRELKLKYEHTKDKTFYLQRMGNVKFISLLETKHLVEYAQKLFAKVSREARSLKKLASDG